MSKKEKMLAGMKGLLAKAKEAQHDMKTNWAAEGSSRQKLVRQVSEGSQRIAQQLKETASTVKKSAESVKKLAPRLPPPLTDAGLLRVLGDCDIDAGATILSHYQKNWQAIATSIQQSADKAVIVDNQVASTLQHVTMRHQQVTALQQELQQLPAVVETLAAIQLTVSSLGKQLTQTEAALNRLDSTIDQIELEHRQRVEQRVFDKHCRAREQELTSLRAAVVSAEQQKERERQRHQQAVLEERRQAFDEVFKEQVKHFKEHGKVETVDVKKSSASMADFHVDDTEGDLEDFLGGQEQASTTDGAGEDSEAQPAEVGPGNTEGAADVQISVEVMQDADPTNDTDLLKNFSPPDSPRPELASDSDVA